MSWRQRQQFLRAITEREKWIRRETKRLNGLRSQIAVHIPEPHFDPEQQKEQAKRLLEQLPPEPDHVINQRRNELIHITIHSKV